MGDDTDTGGFTQHVNVVYSGSQGPGELGSDACHHGFTIFGVTFACKEVPSFYGYF